MAKFTKTDYSDRVEYVLHDDSLPAGCTHSGVNRFIVYKDSGDVRIEIRQCPHGEARSYSDIVTEFESNNVVV